MNAMNRTELINQVDLGYERFLDLVEKLEENEIKTPGVNGDWSIQDIVAHLLVHEERMLTWMIERIAGLEPQTFQPYAMPEKELDVLNEAIYQQNKNRDWGELLFTWRETHVQTVEFLNHVKEEDLFS